MSSPRSAELRSFHVRPGSRSAPRGGAYPPCTHTDAPREAYCNTRTSQIFFNSSAIPLDRRPRKAYYGVMASTDTNRTPEEIEREVDRIMERNAGYTAAERGRNLKRRPLLVHPTCGCGRDLPIAATGASQRTVCDSCIAALVGRRGRR